MFLFVPCIQIIDFSVTSIFSKVSKLVAVRLSVVPILQFESEKGFPHVTCGAVLPLITLINI
jgi:hypothetical protein